MNRTARAATLAAWLALIAASLVLSGCARYRGCAIDPRGERLLISRPPKHFKAVPGCNGLRYDAFLSVTPGKVVAPVGSEVVLIAGVCGNDGYLRADERVEWMIAPGGVGQFVAFDKTRYTHWQLHKLFVPDDTPRKVDNTYLISRTSPIYLTLNRGTPTPTDDVSVLRGQAWTTLSSPVEGTSYVTAFAPKVYGWDGRQRTAQVHWVDAQWSFPPAAINPVGSRHTLVTSVVRMSDRAPLAGYVVRYEIVDGPSIGFAPDGAQMSEVTTDSLGQARAEIFQQDSVPGTNRINVQVIRPENPLTGVGGRLVLGTGSTTKTWTTSASDLAIRISGPAEATVGSTATYRVEASNPGPTSASSLNLSYPIPEGLSFIGSRPALATPPTPEKIELNFAELAPGQSQIVELDFRVDRPGVVTHCATIRAADGRSAQDCVTTTVINTASGLELTVNGPPQALVGDDVPFDILVTNRSNTPETGLVIISRLDAGFQHPLADPVTHAMERTLETIPPGQTQKVSISFRATATGRQCHRVELKGASGVRGSAQACVDVFDRQGDQMARLTVTKTGPRRAGVGDRADFVIDIVNPGSTPLNNVRITDTYDAALEPFEATDGYTTAAQSIVWTIPSLPPGQPARFQVNCRCVRAIAQACNRVVVTTQEGARGEAEACLEVSALGSGAGGQPPGGAPAGPTGPGGLAVTVSDLRDAVATGKELNYEILVRNTSNVSDQQVILSVQVPPQMTPRDVGTSGPARYTVQGQTIRFEPIAEIRPQETLRYHVQVIANQPGDVRVRATATSVRNPAGIAQEESTTIVGGQ